MKALVVNKNGVVRVEEISQPTLEEKSVKIKVKACGICGSDIPRAINNSAHYYPIVLGHEFSGVISEVGEKVHDFFIGDHVVGAPLIPCFHCEDCQKGDYSLCKNYKFIGSRLNGAMAEYIIIPAVNAVKIDKSIRFCDAAFTEPLTVALHGLKQNYHEVGKRVAVLGTGTIGCLTLQAVKHYGANLITAFVRNTKYDNLLHKMGITSIINTSLPNWRNMANIITDGRGFDFVYETAGAIQTMHQAFDIAGNKARICLIGTPKESLEFTVKQWEQLNRKEFYLTGSWMSYSGTFPGTEWKEAVELLKNRSIVIYPEMIHRKVRLLESSNIFEDYKQTGSINGRNLIIMD